MVDIVETFLEKDYHSVDNGDERSAQHGNSRDIIPDFVPTQSSKSITEIFGGGSDEVDAGPSAEHEDVLEDPKVAKYFQYKMNHEKRGIFVVFNHKTFNVTYAGKRTGTDVDRDNLLETARCLGFEEYYHDNLTVKEVKNAIEDYAKKDYQNYDCFACAVLTHGEANDILYANDDKYSLKDILSPFRRCPTLRGKPKLFFIQACRGVDLDQGITICDEVDAGGFDDSTQKYQITIPVEADFFIGYSTVEGYYAWRNGERGSWFIQALCFCLKKYSGSMELLQIMTRVNQMVAYDFESDVSSPKYDKKKQMPSIVTRLTRDVYFRNPQRKKSVEAVDGGVKKALKKTISSDKPKGHAQIDSKKKVLEAKFELSKIQQAKAEIEVKEQYLRQKSHGSRSRISGGRTFSSKQVRTKQKTSHSVYNDITSL